MHDGSVDTQERGDLILIQHRSVAQCRQDKTACRRALVFSLQPFSHREISRCEMGEYRVFQNVVGNLFPRENVHRSVTVASIGLRHCGDSLRVRDFFPIAITITISWCRLDNPKYRESLRPSKPSIGQVFIPNAWAASIRFWQANEV